MKSYTEIAEEIYSEETMNTYIPLYVVKLKWTFC